MCSYTHWHTHTHVLPCSVYIITYCYVFALHNEIGNGAGIKNHVYATVAWLMRRGLSVVILLPSSSSSFCCCCCQHIIASAIKNALFMRRNWTPAAAAAATTLLTSLLPRVVIIGACWPISNAIKSVHWAMNTKGPRNTTTLPLLPSCLTPPSPPWAVGSICCALIRRVFYAADLASVPTISNGHTHTLTQQSRVWPSLLWLPNFLGTTIEQQQQQRRRQREATTTQTWLI